MSLDKHLSAVASAHRRLDIATRQLMHFIKKQTVQTEASGESVIAMDIISNALGLPVGAISARIRASAYVDARHAAYLILRNVLALTWNDIASALGRTHSGCLHGYNAASDRLTHDRQFLKLFAPIEALVRARFGKNQPSIKQP